MGRFGHMSDHVRCCQSLDKNLLDKLNSELSLMSSAGDLDSVGILQVSCVQQMLVEHRRSY